MKLVTYSAGGGAAQAGIVVDEQVHALSGFGLPDSIVEFLKLGDAGMAKLAEASRSASGGTPIGDVKLLPVIPRPTNTFLLAGNYQSHIVEDGRGQAVNKAEITPRIFMKPPTAVIGTGDAIRIPEVSDTVDYEISVGAFLGTSSGEAQTLPEFAHIKPQIVQCFYGEEEDDTLCPKLAGTGAELIKTTGGHHFDGDYEGLANHILDGLKRRVAHAPFPVAQK